jgi:uncharacterized protein with HEPN domain
MNKNHKTILKIIGHIEKIFDYSSGFNKDELLLDSKTLDACLIHLIQIGELANYQLDNLFKRTHNDINWKNINGMRNIITHNYYEIDYNIVYDTITESLPILIHALKKILE